MAVQITFNQPTGAGAGTPGEARNDIWLNQVVECVSSGDGAIWEWTLLGAPPGSAAFLSTPTSSTATFEPDVVGTYRIKLTINRAYSVIRVVRARYDSVGALANRGWALPAVNEEEGEADYGGNTRNWAEPWEFILADILANIGGGGGSITLGGDLGDWDPASADKQQVVGIHGMPVAPAVEADVGKVLQVTESVWFEEVSSMLWDDPYIWVGNGYTWPDSSYVTRFNPSTLEADVVVLAGITNGCVDLAQDATHIFIATNWDNKILIVDKTTLTVVGSCEHPFGGPMWGVAVSGDQVYASDMWNGGIFEFSKSQALSVYPAAATLLQTVTIYSAYSLLVAYGYLWCADSDGNALHKFNLDLTLVGTYTHPAYAYIADIHAAFGAIWVNSDWNTLILRFDDPGNASAPALAAAIDIGIDSGNWLADDGNYLYSCGWSPGQRVYQIDPVSNTLTRTLETDSTSDDVGAIAFDGSVLWAGMYNAASPAAEALGFFELSTYTWDGVRYKGARSLKYASGGGESTRYTSGSLIYVSNDETVTVFGGSFATKICYLPTPLADGERHTISDGTGWGYYYQIIVRSSGGTQLGRIATNYGSLTFVWSVPRGLWVIV